MTVVVVDTHRGNLMSVCNALDYLGATFRVAAEGDEILGAERLVIPGVGAFRSGMERLREKDMLEPLESVRASGAPILGVCLGMQFLGRRSSEAGDSPGLGWIAGDVVRLDPGGLRVPHVGWNDVAWRPESPLFDGLPPRSDFYFVHSFHLVPDSGDVVEGTCEYGQTVTAAVRQGNVAGVQFHPEKSQRAGLAVLSNFLHWSPEC